VYPHDTRLAQQVGILGRNNITACVLCLSGDNQPRVEVNGTVTIFRLMKKPSKQKFVGYITSTTLFGLFSFANLMRLSIGRNFSVIVIHTLPEFLVLVGLFHRILGKAIILDGRDITVELLPSRWQTSASKLLLIVAVLVEKVCMAMCDEVITASPGFKRQLVGRGVPEHKITVMFNTADTRIFTFDKRREFKPILQQARLIYHGTVSERFGLAVAVEAMAKVVAQIPGSKLHIFGFFDKAYRSRIEAIIENLDLREGVVLIEAKPLEAIHQEILTMDIGVVPYLSDNFMNLALSTKTFEYVASGLPVVASRLRSAEEIYSDAALHFAEPGDSRDLADKIVELCKDSEMRKKKRSRAFLEFQHHSDKVVASIFFNLVKKHLKN
jgi:glycosyltransferase involved in cell wall biosynthesis